MAVSGLFVAVYDCTCMYIAARPCIEPYMAVYGRMAVDGCIWLMWVYVAVLNVALYGRIWLHVAVHGCIWLYIWLYLVVYPCIWLYVAEYSYIWLYMDIYGCIAAAAQHDYTRNFRKTLRFPSPARNERMFSGLKVRSSSVSDNGVGGMERGVERRVGMTENALSAC